MTLMLPLAMTSEEAWRLVARVPLSATFWQGRKRCGDRCCKGGASHGPYWFAQWAGSTDGRRHQCYVGSDARKAAILQAHGIVRAEIAKLEEHPIVQALRELETRAGLRPRTRITEDTVDVPILAIGSAK